MNKSLFHHLEQSTVPNLIVGIEEPHELRTKAGKEGKKKANDVYNVGLVPFFVLCLMPSVWFAKRFANHEGALLPSD